MLEQEAWLRLKLIPGLGNAGMIRLLQGLHTPQAVVQASVSMLTPFVTATQAANMVNLQPKITAAVEHHQQWLAQPDHHLITLADPDYPACLFDLPDPPVLFFAKGCRAQLQAYAIAMVGSRNPAEQGIRHAREFAKAFASVPLATISGLAAGIDTAAHEGVLHGGGTTIAVVGTGLDIVYPAHNKALAQAIAQQGLLLSEFTLGTAPKPAHFPMRNRLIAALSRGCLVVEAALQSGSLITARQALELGREVFAIPGSIHSPLSKGCHVLIKSGAKLVESVEDIVSELNIPIASPVKKERVNTHSVNTTHADILSQMGYDPVSLDDLVAYTGKSVDALSAALLLLEMEEHVVGLADGRYQRRI